MVKNSKPICQSEVFELRVGGKSGAKVEECVEMVLVEASFVGNS